MMKTSKIKIKKLHLSYCYKLLLKKRIRVLNLNKS